MREWVCIFLLFVAVFGTVSSQPSEEHGLEDEYIKLTLKDPIEMEIPQNEVKTFHEPGWRIHSSKNRDVVVHVDIPPAMRRGEVGRYEIVYNAYIKNHQEDAPLATASRFVNVIRVNQCALGLHNCSKFANCIDTEKGYECQCLPGYRGNGEICENIDECAENLHDCSPFAYCIDTRGGFICQCKPGFTGNGQVCVDIDECASKDLNNCSEDAICNNAIGGFECECKPGFEGNGIQCAPIDVCARGKHNCPENAHCVLNVVVENGFRCVCNPGWEGNGLDCKDIDECLNPHACPLNQDCKNLPGNFTCECKPGYEKVNGICVDIDECERGYADCHPHAICHNEVPFYHCSCKEGYEGDGKTCTDITAPRFLLNGDPNSIIHQFQEYMEPGLEFVDDTTNISLIVDIPKELEGTVRKCGSFNIDYEVIDRNTKISSRLTRTVNVIATNQCALPQGSPFRHHCHPLARCEHLESDCTYRCYCPIGFNGTGIGPTGCVDALPPTIIYHGDDPHYVYQCRVCGEMLQDDDVLNTRIIHRAKDITPHEDVDVSDTLALVILPHPTDPNCVIQKYTAFDAVGNIGERTATVCKKVEDIHQMIMDMKALYSWQIFIIKSIGYLAGVGLLILLVWEFGYRMSAFVRVFILYPLYGPPGWPDFDIAYSIWFRILHPFASQKAIREMVHNEFEDQHNDDVEDEEGDEEDEESEED